MIQIGSDRSQYDLIESNDISYPKYTIHERIFIFGAIVLFSLSFCTAYAFNEPGAYILMSTTNTTISSDDTTSSCNVGNAALSAAAIATAAAGTAVVGFWAVGLSWIGPIAGGIFASAQGAGVVAGSAMAIAQSASMSSGTYVVAAYVGSALGVIAACV